MNTKLLVELKTRGLTQKRFAELVGDDPSIVSRVISGIWNLDVHKQETYARVLGLKREDVFGREGQTRG